MNIPGHGKKYRNWTLYFHERLGDVTGMAARIEKVPGQSKPIIHRTVTFENDSISNGVSISKAIRDIRISVVADIERVEAELKAKRDEAVKKLMRKKP